MCIYNYIYIHIYIFTYYVLGQKLPHHTQKSFEIGAFEAEEGFVLDEAAPLLAAAPPTPAISAKAMAQGTEAGWFFGFPGGCWGPQTKETDFGIKFWGDWEWNLLERSVNWWECLVEEWHLNQPRMAAEWSRSVGWGKGWLKAEEG